MGASFTGAVRESGPGARAVRDAARPSVRPCDSRATVVCTAIAPLSPYSAHIAADSATFACQDETAVCRTLFVHAFHEPSTRFAIGPAAFLRASRALQDGCV